MGIKKAKTIAKAFLSELPVNEEWYKERISICESCELNSDNKQNPTLIERLRKDTMNRFCTACLCDIDRKCSVKTEECGMVKLDPPQQPKWNMLEVDSPQRDNVTVENLTPHKTKLSLSGNEYLFDFGQTEDITIETSFIVNRKSGLKILSIMPSCGCTTATINSFTNKSAKISVKISTLGFKSGINEKTISIKYQDGNLIKDVNIRFRNIIKPK